MLEYTILQLSLRYFDKTCLTRIVRLIPSRVYLLIAQHKIVAQKYLTATTCFFEYKVSTFCEKNKTHSRAIF